MECNCKKCCNICKKVVDTSDLLKLVAEPNRLRVLCLLREGSRSAGDISKSLDVPHNLVSFHLKTLLEEDFLSRRKEGNKIYYSIKSDKKKKVQSIIDLFNS